MKLITTFSIIFILVNSIRNLGSSLEKYEYLWKNISSLINPSKTFQNQDPADNPHIDVFYDSKSFSDDQDKLNIKIKNVTIAKSNLTSNHTLIYLIKKTLSLDNQTKNLYFANENTAAVVVPNNKTIITDKTISSLGKMIYKGKARNKRDCGPYVCPNNMTSICLSPFCVSLASRILQNIDITVDPCHDFYDYACGGWRIKNEAKIIYGKNSWDQFKEINRKNKLFFKNILEAPNITNSSAIKQAQIYYQSCLNENKINSLNAQPLKKLVEIYGGWQNLDIKSKNGTKLKSSKNDSLVASECKDKMLRNLMNLSIDLGSSVFFVFNVAKDDKNSSLNVLSLSEGTLILGNREFYLKNLSLKDEVFFRRNPILLIYYQCAVLLLKSIFPHSKSNIDKIMKEVLELEVFLALIKKNQIDTNELTSNYNPMTMQQLDREFNFINWTSYVNSLMSKNNITIAPNQTIIVSSPSYFKRLTLFFNEYIVDEHNCKITQNYIIWYLTTQMIGYISQKYINFVKPIFIALLGMENESPRWELCVDETNKIFGTPLSTLFIKREFKNHSKEKAESLIIKIKSAFKKNLESVDWMDSETKNLAALKTDAIEAKVGYPDYIFNQTYMEDAYKEFNFSDQMYFKNIVVIKKVKRRRYFKQLNQIPNKASWFIPPSTVNGFYSFIGNEMIFPAGILQSPLYDKDFPRSLNFGSIGFVIGHEIIHAFDNTVFAENEFNVRTGVLIS
ncbi:unnamed protein product [Gordionus sp. m RMFG-2023]